MSREEFLKKIRALRVNDKYFSLGPEIKDNAYNIEILPNLSYQVYYLERNEKNDLKVFKTEEGALEDLFRRIEFNIKNKLDLS